MKAWLKSYKWLQRFTIGILAIMIVYGLVITLFELKPFWLDEWFIIYNLKFKSSTELWGQLDLTQQSPRAYLQIVKLLTEAFNYSYTSLRLPSFVVHSVGIVFCYLLSRRLFKPDSPYRFLWVLIYASYFTSVHYFVQVKQYTMDMLLALVAIWQLTELLSISYTSRLRYILLSVVSLIIPYFSYTYPICFVPVPIVILMSKRETAQGLWLAFFPILLTLASVMIFYVIDVSQVMQDKGMQDYWKGYLMSNGFSIKVFAEKVYRLFANMGAGAVFEIIFGTIGLSGLLYGTFCFTKKGGQSIFQHTVRYSVILIWLVIALFVLHKLPLGAHRLNAFAIPAAGILIVNLLIALGKSTTLSRFVPIFSSLLAVAAGAGILTSFADQLWGKEALITRRIYKNVGEGINLAVQHQLPIAVTPGIGYPFEEGEKDWALKTHPNYDVQKNIRVYPIVDINALITLQETDNKLRTVVFIEKEHHKIVTR